MRITKSQLQKVIKEAVKEEMGDRISGTEMLAMYDKEQGLDVMSAEEAMDELEQILKDIRKTSNDDRSSQQADRAEDLLRVIVRGDSPRYETSAEADLAKFQKDRFSGR